MADSSQTPTSSSAAARAVKKAAPVIIVGSVMFSFISYWRVAAVVLCDLASTAFYIGGVVEQAIGPAAPWYILAVMLFSYAVRAVYIESCSLFVRGGVYRVVKEAIGAFPAKAAVSALLFDYILTGPISAASAGQYLIGWFLELMALVDPNLAITETARRAEIKQYGAIVLVWCGITLVVKGPVNRVPIRPDLSPKVQYEVETGPDRMTGELREQWKRDPATGKLVPQLDAEGREVPRTNSITGHQEDPLGFLPSLFPSLAERLRSFDHVLSFIGILGLALAFGHSILAMSGEETMAQVYREVESPKLPNFKKAAFVIFAYSLILTAGISFLAILLIPDEVRIKEYADNLLGGLAMHVIGPAPL